MLGLGTSHPLDPLIFLHLGLPLGVALGLNYAMLIALAGFGMALFLRDQGMRSRVALSAGAVMFALNPFFVSWLTYRVFMAGLASLPLALWALDRILTGRGSRRAIGVLALAMGYPMVASTIQLVALFALILIVRAAFLLLRGRAGQSIRARAGGLLGVGGALALALALGGVTLWASIELYLQSTRSGSLADYYGSGNFLHWRALALWFHPGVFGGPSREEFAVFQLFQRTGFGSSGWGALGIIPLWLALMALLRGGGPRSERLFWGILGAGVLLFLLLADPFQGVLRGIWSGVAQIDLLRGLVVVNLAGSILAAWGTERLVALWNQPGQGRRWILPWTLYVGLGAVILMVCQWGIETPGSLLEDLGPLLAIFVLMLGVGLVPQRLASVRGCALVLFIAGELLWIHFRFNPFAPTETAYPRTAMTSAIAELTGPPDYARLAIKDLTRALPPNTASVFGIPNVTAYTSVPIRRYRMLIEAAERKEFQNREVVSNLASPIYRLLGVRYLLTAGSLPENRLYVPVALPAMGERFYERVNTLPRAFLVHEGVPVDGEEEMRRRLGDRGFDPARRIYLDRADGSLPLMESATGPESVRITHKEPHRMILEVEASAPALLVVSDAFYPGWEVRVDGARTPILPVNGGLRGMPVGDGAHTVVMRYAPRWLVPGLVAMVVGLFVALGLVAWRGGDGRAHRLRGLSDRSTVEPATRGSWLGGS